MSFSSIFFSYTVLNCHYTFTYYWLFISCITEICLELKDLWFIKKMMSQTRNATNSWLLWSVNIGRWNMSNVKDIEVLFLDTRFMIEVENMIKKYITITLLKIQYIWVPVVHPSRTKHLWWKGEAGKIRQQVPVSSRKEATRKIKGWRRDGGRGCEVEICGAYLGWDGMDRRGRCGMDGGTTQF